MSAWTAPRGAGKLSGTRSFSSACTITFQRNSSTNVNSSFAACSNRRA
jgi:hypothetical protein